MGIYFEAFIGFIELLAIGGVVVAICCMFSKGTARDNAPVIGIVSAGVMLVAIQVGKVVVGDHGPMPMFTTSEMQGRQCKDMHTEAKALGAQRWACLR